MNNSKNEEMNIFSLLLHINELEHKLKCRNHQIRVLKKKLKELSKKEGDTK